MWRWIVMATCVFGVASTLAADSAGPAAAASAPEKSQRPPEPASSASTAVSTAPQESWQQRQERLQKEYQLRQRAAELRSQLNRPTQWQLQNPSGARNHYPTELPRGYTAPNTYFGPEHRSWSNLSAPVSLPQMPAGYYTPPLAIFSDAPLTTNTWWGAASQGWSNIRIGGATPSSTGGWNYIPGP